MDAAHSPIALLLAGNILFKRKKSNYCSRKSKKNTLLVYTKEDRMFM